MPEINPELKKAVASAENVAMLNYKQGYDNLMGGLKLDTITTPAFDLPESAYFSQLSQGTANQIKNITNSSLATITNSLNSQLNLLNSNLLSEQSQMGQMVGVGNDIGFNESTRNTFGLADSKRVATQQVNQLTTKATEQYTDVLNKAQGSFLQVASQDEQLRLQEQTRLDNAYTSLGLTRIGNQLLQNQTGRANDVAYENALIGNETAAFNLSTARALAPTNIASTKLGLEQQQLQIDVTKAEIAKNVDTTANGVKVGSNVLTIPIRMKDGDTSILDSHFRDGGLASGLIGKDGKALDIKGTNDNKYTQLLGQYGNGNMDDNSKAKFLQLRTAMENDYGKGFGIAYTVDLSFAKNEKNESNIYKPIFTARALDGVGFLPLNGSDAKLFKGNEQVVWADGKRPDQVMAKRISDYLLNPEGDKTQNSVAKNFGKMVFEAPRLDGSVDLHFAFANTEDGKQGFSYAKIDSLTKEDALKLQQELTRQSEGGKKLLTLEAYKNTMGAVDVGKFKDKFTNTDITQFGTALNNTANNPGSYRQAMAIIGAFDYISDDPTKNKLLYEKYEDSNEIRLRNYNFGDAFAPSQLAFPNPDKLNPDVEKLRGELKPLKDAMYGKNYAEVMKYLMVSDILKGDANYTIGKEALNSLKNNKFDDISLDRYQDLAIFLTGAKGLGEKEMGAEMKTLQNYFGMGGSTTTNATTTVSSASQDYHTYIAPNGII